MEVGTSQVLGRKLEILEEASRGDKRGGADHSFIYHLTASHSWRGDWRRRRLDEARRGDSGQQWSNSATGWLPSGRLGEGGLGHSATGRERREEDLAAGRIEEALNTKQAQSLVVSVLVFLMGLLSMRNYTNQAFYSENQAQALYSVWLATTWIHQPCSPAEVAF